MIILINGITDKSVSSSSCPTGMFSSLDESELNQEHADVIIKMKVIKLLKKNLRKLLKLITFFQTLNVNKTTIILVMQHLKMVAEEVDLVILIFLVLFQIYLKIFLEKVLVVVEEDQEDLITVALI